MPALVLFRSRPALALSAAFLAFFAFDAAAPFFAEENYLVFGAIAVQPMILGVWTALAAGSMLTRMPAVLGCMMLLLLAPVLNRSTVPDMNRFEYIVAVVAGLATYFAATLLFLAVRKLLHIRIILNAAHIQSGKPSVQFSIKYPLALMTLVAIAFGMASRLQFNPARASFFGPEFVIMVYLIGAPIILAILSPILAAPLFILYRGPRERAVRRAIGAWAGVTMLAMVIGTALDANEFPELIAFILLSQAGALVAGILTAFPLRLAGVELVRTLPPTLSLANPQPPVLSL